MTRNLVRCAVSMAVFCSSMPAWAEEHTAPLFQKTQPSYVPQSVALSGPAEIDHYDPEAPIPPGYTPVKRKRVGLIIGGSVVFGVFYIFATLAASGAEAGALYIPVAGPFLQCGETKDDFARGLLVHDGIGQIAGLGMLLGGLTDKIVLRRNDLVVQPVVTGAGFGVSGRF